MYKNVLRIENKIKCIAELAKNKNSVRKKKRNQQARKRDNLTRSLFLTEAFPAMVTMTTSED